MRNSTSNLLILLTLAVAAGIVGYVLWHAGDKVAVKRIGFQDADTPLGMPEKGAPDHRFHFLSAWQTAQIPLATRFDPPMGSEHGGLVYNAQKFWEMNEKRGGHHTGDDLNGIGGMNSDLGDPVFSTADGLVLYTGEPSPGWGKLVVIAHRTADGKTLHSMHAHLDRIDVARGMLVARGAKVGTVGTANGYYPAHLHFEIRASDGVDIGAGYAMYPLNRLDPMAAVASLRNAEPDDLTPSPLALALTGGAAPWTSLEIRGAEKFSELLDEPH
jgi:Peptidase family M23